MDSMTQNRRTCTRCVMNTTDPDIHFAADGVCNHCRLYDTLASRHVVPAAQREMRLARVVEEISQAGRGKDYDCVIGVSGGVDSTYVAYQVKRLGLRPLAVHLDNGWDSELAVKNIENVLRRVEVDLHTHVLDWDVFSDLQCSFLKASTPDSEIPSDHAIMAVLHQMAAKIGVRYVVTGFNVRNESHMPSAWSQGHWDWKYIRSVQRQHGTRSLRSFPHTTLLDHARYRLTQRWVHVLNYLDYAKTRAMPVLERELGWKYYGGKHYESVYTRFYQGYILPRKFGYDKRRAHLSSMVCSGEMTRKAALEELERETYPSELQEEDRAYVIKKLGLTEATFEDIMALPHRSRWDYPNSGQFFRGPIYTIPRVVYRATLKPLVTRAVAS